MLSIQAFHSAANRPIQTANTTAASAVRFSGTGSPIQINNVKEAAALLQGLLYDARVAASDQNRQAREAVREQALAKADNPIDQWILAADPVRGAYADVDFMQRGHNHFESFRTIVANLEAKEGKTPVEEQAVKLGKFMIANETAHYTDVNPVTFEAVGGRPGATYSYFVFKDQTSNGHMYTVANPGVNFSELLRAVAQNDEITSATIEAYNKDTNATINPTL